MRQLSLITAAAFLAAGLLAARAHATQVTYSINGNGFNEVTAGGTPGQGDPDATDVGTLTLDDVAGTATLNITLANLDLTTLSGHHIHNAPATTTGAIVLDFGDPDTIRSGSVLSGTITGLSTATIDNVFANPTNFYYNIHNGQFPGGAVRSQLPEPGSMALMALGGLSLLRRRAPRG
jgi:hypothetical protein